MVVDITDTFASKYAALTHHESQVGDRDGLEEMLRDGASRVAERAGLGVGRLAEGYRSVTTG